MNSTFDPPLWDRHDLSSILGQFEYRPRDQLPYDLSDAPPGVSLMLDATVYIDAQRGKLPPALAARLVDSEILHSAVALAEIAASLGLLDPADPRTPGTSQVLRDTIAKSDAARTLAPSPAAWLEAAVIAGALARAQRYEKHVRRKLLNDVLILLSAAEAGALLVSRNARDMDLLLRLRPDARVLLYDVE